MATPVPAMLLPTKEQEGVLAYLEKIVEESEERLAHTVKAENENFEQWLSSNMFQKIPVKNRPRGLVASLDFDNQNLVNSANGNGKNDIRMRQQFVDNEKAIYKEGASGKGLFMDGDTWLDLDKIGVYKRNEPFSISIKVFIPNDYGRGSYLS
ncbi:hypothetical protein [Zobellia laminariae]|uniref:hypothetical protein n=1 Tax=Zobellia laminariae TaxID=248906 RepID=UPI0026F4692E|nr:hypothetical protein [Zobellia laminariae]WKX75478.1 hypothetical protein Q5W13_17745 [Zobellia laminariae]